MAACIISKSAWEPVAKLKASQSGPGFRERCLSQMKELQKEREARQEEFEARKEELETKIKKFGGDFEELKTRSNLLKAQSEELEAKIKALKARFYEQADYYLQYYYILNYLTPTKHGDKEQNLLNFVLASLDSIQDPRQVVVESFSAHNKLISSKVYGKINNTELFIRYCKAKIPAQDILENLQKSESEDGAKGEA